MAKKIKVLSVGHSYVVALNRSILRELSKDPSFEVTIGAPSVFKGSLRTIECEPEPANSNIKLVKLDAYLTQKMHVFSYNPWQLKSLMKQGFDCAHFWEEPYIFAGFQLGRQAAKSKIPFLFRTAQSLIKDYIFPFNHFEKLTRKRSSAWVAGGNLVYAAMMKKGFKKPGQVLTLAVDTAQFQPLDKVGKEKVRAELGLSEPVIGYLGRLSEEKGCDLFMEALGHLKDKPWSFLVMGSGPYKDKIENWAAKHNISERVKVRLFDHDEVPKVLPVCDLLICPSQTRKFWKEQFGRMIVEGFAAGVPVMGSDSGEIPRVIGEAGVVLPEADVKVWQEALDNFLTSPQEFQKYRNMGLERVHRYSAIAIAEQYKELYRKLAEDPSLRSG